MLENDFCTRTKKTGSQGGSKKEQTKAKVQHHSEDEDFPMKVHEEGSQDVVEDGRGSCEDLEW